MNSISEQCNDLKNQYDVCFQSWFTDSFLKGNAKDDDQCANLFKLYTQCIKKAMKEQQIDLKEIEKNHIKEKEDGGPQDS